MRRTGTGAWHQTCATAAACKVCGGCRLSGAYSFLVASLPSPALFGCTRAHASLLWYLMAILAVKERHLQASVRGALQTELGGR
jgi:hypothetical protein